MPTVQAIYEHGVFTPLSKVELNESARVAIRVVPLDDWQDRFNRLLSKVRRQSSAFTTEEIETDIRDAVREAKTAKHG
jgi:predicted DNA-binding antitoxin AbrB/MazE fold protein